eukprot:TRINITY_DN3214_c0_g1_i14.p1 TRINITY_DN3214_c0_g1~~TRINITY_DN3214_c0_g1_i14.p1  ORF type:complete len:467 (+),score=10.59 TRINITY_DN3214_c0_g1_i14:405-1805(+)
MGGSAAAMPPPRTEAGSDKQPAASAILVGADLGAAAAAAMALMTAQTSTADQEDAASTSLTEHVVEGATAREETGTPRTSAHPAMKRVTTGMVSDHPRSSAAAGPAGTAAELAAARVAFSPSASGPASTDRSLPPPATGKGAAASPPPLVSPLLPQAVLPFRAALCLEPLQRTLLPLPRGEFSLCLLLAALSRQANPCHRPWRRKTMLCPPRGGYPLCLPLASVLHQRASSRQRPKLKLCCVSPRVFSSPAAVGRAAILLPLPPTAAEGSAAFHPTPRAPPRLPSLALPRLPAPCRWLRQRQVPERWQRGRRAARPTTIVKSPFGQRFQHQPADARRGRRPRRAQAAVPVKLPPCHPHRVMPRTWLGAEPGLQPGLALLLFRAAALTRRPRCSTVVGCRPRWTRYSVGRRRWPPASARRARGRLASSPLRRSGSSSRKRLIRRRRRRRGNVVRPMTPSSRRRGCAN